MALYLSKRAELTFSALRMNRVAISLYDVVKTPGEIKDTFRFTYNGRRYARLSLSEKVRAGMEVSEMMKRLTGRNYRYLWTTWSPLRIWRMFGPPDRSSWQSLSRAQDCPLRAGLRLPRRQKRHKQGTGVSTAGKSSL
jgi:hypothetical protein